MRGDFSEAFYGGRKATLRQFGRGVWQILSGTAGDAGDRLLIEGGWGSFTSYFSRSADEEQTLDGWRPITIGLSEPTPRTVDHNQPRDTESSSSNASLLGE